MARPRRNQLEIDVTSDVVKVETRGAAGIIQLNRPEKHNALSLDLLRAIGRAVVDFEEAGTVRAVVLTGSEKAFSTGADLNEALKATTPRDALHYAGEFRKLGTVIERSALPVIAAINGYCITGGLELALMCDIRLTAPNAVFGITSAKIGSVPGAGGSQRLPRLVGPAKAKELLFTCDYIDAAEAYRINLVNHLIAEGSVLDAAIAMADKMAARAPLSLAWLKELVNVGMNTDLESSLSYELQLCSSAFMTQDRREGMSAFLEKRPAQFKGK